MKKIVMLVLFFCILLNVMQANVFAIGKGPEAKYEKGMGCFEENDFDVAFAYFQISGEVEGYAPSQNMLGVCYRDGLGTEQNFEEAEKYFKMSANQGYGPAQENLDAMFPERAEKGFEKSEAYQNAMNLFFEKKYEEAKVAFEELGDYERSVDFLVMCEEALKESKGIAYTKDLKVGEYITFGSYEQDNDLSNGKEPIEWLILFLEENRALLISRYALSCQKYNITEESVTWETCTLRAWLNESFLREAFSATDQKKILTTSVSADIGNYRSVRPGNPTHDMVFLLSHQEVSKYLLANKRGCEGTSYCYAQGARKNNNGDCSWWLRTPGVDSCHVAAVDYFNGLTYINLIGFKVDETIGAVRPAMWINIEAIDEKSSTALVESQLESTTSSKGVASISAEYDTASMNQESVPAYYLVEHTVQNDEDLVNICETLGTNYYEYSSVILRVNNMANANDFKVGQTLWVPAKVGSEDGTIGVFAYSVKKDETINEICAKYGTSYADIKSAVKAINPHISNIEKLSIGQTVYIPCYTH